MIREIKDTINVRVRNNTAFTQNVNLLGGTADPLAVPPSLLYQWDLSNETFSGTLTAKIIISNTSNPTPVTYTVQVTQLNVSGVADALNTLNLGVFQVSGNIIYVSNDYYIYGALSVSGVSILGTTGLNPIGITIDSVGNIFTSNNSSNDVSKITPLGVSTILASTSNPPVAITIDSVGNLYLPIPSFNSVAKITPFGVASSFGFTGGFPTCITIDSGGFIYTANSVGNNITKITPLGINTNYGNLNGENPVGIVVDSVGNVFVVCSANVVRKVTPAGVSSNFGVFSLGNTLTSIAIDSSDNIYVSDNSNQIIYKLTPSAVQTTYGTSTNNPQQIAIDSSDNIYCVNQNGTVDKILAIGGTITLADLSVYLGSPYAIIVDSFFNVYVTDANNNVVYLIVQ